MRGVLGLFLVLAIAGCGSSADPSGDDGGVTPAVDAATATDAGPTGLDGGSGALDAGAVGSDAGSTGTDAGSASSYPFCRMGCSAPADCATPSLELYDATHYACEAGICRWTGCQDDAECQAAFSSSGYACRVVSGLAQCVETCAGPSDCGSGLAAFDADNYTCGGGTCTYTGCRDDAECASTFSSDRYVCREARLPSTGLPIPMATRNCVMRCTSASECATSSAAFDADNYECIEGACVYAGCNGDAECESAFSSSRYVCR
jgi:hypothetical protein